MKYVDVSESYAAKAFKGHQSFRIVKILAVEFLIEIFVKKFPSNGLSIRHAIRMMDNLSAFQLPPGSS